MKNVYPIFHQAWNSHCHPLPHSEGKAPVQIFIEVVKTVYGDKVKNCTSEYKWCCEFKNSRTSAHNDQRSERPSIVTDELEEKIDNVLRDNHRLMPDELPVKFPKIFRSLLHETIKEILIRNCLWDGSQTSWQNNINWIECRAPKRFWRATNKKAMILTTNFGQNNDGIHFFGTIKA